MLHICFLLILCCFDKINGIPTNYMIGVGRADITGPAADVNMMGYANPAQVSDGLHLRQFSRAFIIADDTSRIVFVNTDACMVSQGMKLEILKQLRARFGDKYTEKNLCISGTHTHSGPGGFHQYLLYDITSLGFVRETFDTYVSGIVQSIVEADKSLQPGNIFVNTGELLDSNINRSPNAYQNNPAIEKARYKYDVDKNMTVLKFVDANNNGIGMISWFAVHCTSMNNTNHLVSSDNKGYAEILMETMMNKGAFPGQGKFVAAFAQSNEGDVSPNTKGPHCLDTGLPCNVNTSTCNGRNELCVAFGPGKDMFESTKIIATNQFEKALDLYNTAVTPLSGPVNFRHTYSDMTKVEVQLNSTTKIQTCRPAMGYSFAAGTTDGPGAFDFKQGNTNGSAIWNLVRDFIKPPSDQAILCHKPKPILLDTGEITEPYMWEPEIVDNQIFTIGQFAIIAVPGEFSTMSGRRVRDAIKAALLQGGFPQEPIPVIAGLSNDYADYVTTFEEYQEQRYEGASTIYGPYTLDAYIQILSDLALRLAKGEDVPAGPPPPNLLDKQIGLLPGVVYDGTPSGKSFGEVLQQPQQTYKRGDTVAVRYQGASPRNSEKPESTFLEVQLQQSNNWITVFTDAHWETKFFWKRTNTLRGESEVTVTWDIPSSAQPGMYRILYHGKSKPIFGDMQPFTGTSSEFTVITTLTEEETKTKYDNLKKKLDFLKKINGGKGI